MHRRLDWTPAEIARRNARNRAAWGSGRDRGQPADPDADVESAAGDDAVAAKAVPRFDSPVRLSVDHYRHRLVDVDAPSIKAALDQCVREGICADDTTAHIVEVRHRQHRIPRSQDERTDFTFERV